MEPKNVSFGQMLGLFWPIHHRQLYSYKAKSSEVLEPNHSQGTATRNLKPLGKWYKVSHTYQEYKMEPKNTPFCQRLGLFWQIDSKAVIDT
jgi:hypothetical protein